MPDTSPTDRHRIPAVIARPDPAIRKQSAEILKANDWKMNEFFDACLGMLAQSPDATLALLVKFRTVRKRGRPPKSK